MKIKYDHKKMIKLYESGMSTREVADQMNCGKSTVSAAMKKAGVSRPRRIRQHILEKRVNVCKEFSEEFRKYLDGLLISDGHLKVPSTHVKTSSYRQTSLSKEWLESIQKRFEEYGISSVIRPEKRHPINLVLRTKHYDKLYVERLRWYPKKKKLVPEDLDLGDASLLKNWIYGDGTLCGPTTFRFCTDSFSFKEMEKLKMKFFELGHSFKYVSMGKTKQVQEKRRLAICKRDGLFEFFEAVGKPDIQYFGYKWPVKKKGDI